MDLVGVAFAREFDAITARRHHQFRLMGCCLQQQQDDPFEDQLRNMFLRMQETMKSVEDERDALRSKCEELQNNVTEYHVKLKGKRTELKKCNKTIQLQEENLRKSAVLLAIVTHHADELEHQISRLSKWQLVKKRLEKRVQKLLKDREELTGILIKALEKKKEIEAIAKKSKKKLQEDYSALTSKVDILETELEDRRSYIYLIESELDRYMQQVVTITNDKENYEDDDDEPEAVHKEQGHQQQSHEVEGYGGLEATISFDYADAAPASSAETNPEITKKQPTLAVVIDAEDNDITDHHVEVAERASTSNTRLSVSMIAQQSTFLASTGMELSTPSYQSSNRDAPSGVTPSTKGQSNMSTTTGYANWEQYMEDRSPSDDSQMATPRRKNKNPKNRSSEPDWVQKR
jgi:hypothetical protein